MEPLRLRLCLLGLTNTPAILINRVCKPYLEEFVRVSINDILEMYFFGHVVNPNGIHVDPSKIEAVKNQKAPTVPSEERSFLDFGGCYGTSNRGLRCVLMQRGRRGGITSTVRRVSSTRITKAFKHIFNQKELNMRQKRWIEVFSDYEYEIYYHPGKANVVADALSRKEWVKPRNMERKEDESLYAIDRIWVPLVGGMRTMIIDEAHKSKYSMHPGADKMYHDLRDMYWWP
ncbi:putative reverse transcriptase domain-containing protein [Tanacetum coccineum]